jgi:hypothetical protein
MLYITYKCTTCRRQKDIEWDSQRVVPLHCTITKGCNGSLSPTGQTTAPTPVLPVDGITDWYPRNQSPEKSTAPITPTEAYLNTSTTGGLVLAVREPNENYLPSAITLTLSQRRGDNVSFSQYLFRPLSLSTISGKDVNGKNLRFDADAISEGRISVRVNGVLRTDMTLTANTITFDSPVSGTVDVIVYTQPILNERQISVSRNKFGELTPTRGAWYNVSYILKFSAGVYQKWWLYTADIVDGLDTGKLKVTKIEGVPGPIYSSDDIILLHADMPYATVDRTLTHVVPIGNLLDDFDMYFDTSIMPRLVIPWTALEEIYPPLVVNASGRLEADPVQTTASSAVVTDDLSNVRIPTSKILGPV